MRSIWPDVASLPRMDAIRAAVLGSMGVRLLRTVRVLVGRLVRPFSAFARIVRARLIVALEYMMILWVSALLSLARFCRSSACQRQARTHTRWRGLRAFLPNGLLSCLA